MAHEHHHEHHHDHHRHDYGARGAIVRIVLAAVLLGVANYVERTMGLPTWQLLLVYLVPYLMVGIGTINEAIEGITSGDVFNENLLMCLATVGALAIGFLPGAETEFPEAVFVMLFFQVGELFEGYAQGKSRESISKLMDIRPDKANVERDGREQIVDAENVGVGETIVIRPGERVALDGVVSEGASTLDTVALTGESVPRELGVGDEVLSGSINLSGMLRVRTTKTFGESTASKIIRMVESASENKSKSENFITRFARVYTPIVFFLALSLAVIPPMVLSGTFINNFPTWLYRGLMFLIVSCPCALVISVPLTFFGGIGGASRKGILVKGSNYMETLAHAAIAVFDKTGTLTLGKFAVTTVHPDKIDKQELLHLAAHVEHYSTHPIGAALRDAYPMEATDGCEVSQVSEVAGQGVTATVGGRQVAVGNTKLMDGVGAEWHLCPEDEGTVVHVAVDGVYAGHIVINDSVKPRSAEAIASLHRLGVKRCVMLTGDAEKAAASVARELGIGEYAAELLPTDKVERMEKLLAEKEEGQSLVFVGDGINDAPVLARADVGIAMGAMGSDAAIEAADVVLMDDNPNRVATAIGIARHTVGIARQNVAFAIGIKVAIMLLAVVGLGNLGLAVFADVGVMVVAVLNSMRALRFSVV